MLLPEGFYDLLYQRAAREQALEQMLLSLFAEFGYRRVAPPLIEYEETLLGHRRAGVLDCFRVVDASTQRMMALRCDMTLQVARIAATRLPQAPRPLRLSYAGVSLRTRTSAAKPHRQFSQIGCEIFGDNSPRANAEMLEIVGQAVVRCGVKSPMIEISTPSLLRLLAQKLNLNAQQTERVAKIFAHRALGEAHALPTNTADEKALSGASIALLSCQRDHDAQRTLADLRAQPALACLEALWEKLARTLDLCASTAEISYTLDPIEARGFSYHEDFAFTILCQDTRGALGRGGAYRSPFDVEPAAGFSFYLDALGEAVPPKRATPRIYAVCDASLEAIAQHRHKGTVVVQALQTETYPQSLRTAQEQDCQEILNAKGLQRVTQKTGRSKQGDPTS